MRIIPLTAPFGVVTVLCVCVSPLSAQERNQVGERAEGMAGAFVAVADDASAIYWNPAGLATGSTFDAEVDLLRRSAPAESVSTRIGFAGVAMPMLGVGYYRVRSGVSPSGDRQNGGSGEVRATLGDRGNVGISLLQTIERHVVVGSTLRIVNGLDRTAFDLDLGLMATLGAVRAGLIARNVREAVETEREVRIGGAYVPRSLPSGVFGPFSVSFDADLTQHMAVGGQEREAAIGAEQWWAHGAFASREGLRWSTTGDAKHGFAGGFTVRLPRSLFAEGHLTKGAGAEQWGIGIRVTF